MSMRIQAAANRLLVAYTNGLPYHPGKWRVANAFSAVVGLEAYYRGRRLRVRRAGVEWELHPECMVQRSVYLWGEWEPDDTREFKKLVTTGSTVLDVGSYFGYYSLVACQTTSGSARVFAFEPYPPNFAMLNRNISLNYFPLLEAVNVAVSRRSGTAFFRVPPDYNRGSGGLTESRESGIQVATVPLDEYVGDRGIDAVDVMKVDAEGSEVDVLHGAEGVISAFRPAMMVELDPGKLAKLGHSSADLVKLIKRFGYELWSADRRGLTRLADVIPSPDGFANLICLR